MAASNDEKLLDVLNDNKTNIKKIAIASHHFLLVTSMKNAREIIQKKEAEGEISNKDQKKYFFDELVKNIYEKKKNY